MMTTVAGKKGRLLCLAAALALIFLFQARPSYAEDAVQQRMGRLASSKSPVLLQADSVSYDMKSKKFVGTGNVRITQGNTVLTADRVTMDEDSGDAEATGHARLTTDSNVLFAESIKVNFDTKLGVIERGTIFVQKENYHITGDNLDRVSEGEYRVTKGTLTTCDAVTPAWMITAGSLNVRMDRDVTAKDVVFRIKDVPVFYTPYAWFPLIKPRTTGFLFPGIGYSTKQGLRLFNSFYWAPLDNFDATLNLDYRARRGLGIGGDVRFALDKDTNTKLKGYYMDDRLDKRERYSISLKHQQLFMDNLSGKADINFSDRQFYRQLADTAQERTQRSIDSNVFVTDWWDYGRAYFFGQYTLNLDTNDHATVQRLPELGFNIVKKRLFDLPIYLDTDGSASYFVKKEGVDGSRFDVSPKLSGNFSVGGINFSPRLGYRETVYGLTGNEKGKSDDERGLFGAGITTQTAVSRLYTFVSGPFTGLRHTIEPVIAYDYVLRRGGTDFTKFDGVDTYGRRNLVAYAVTNRFVLKYRDGGKAPMSDYLTIKLSQFYDLYRDNKVSGVRRHFSSIYGEVVYKAGNKLTVNNDFRYNIYSGQFLSVNTDVKYSFKGDDWYMVLGQRFSSDTDQTFMSPSRFDLFTPSTDFVSEFTGAATNQTERLNFLTAGAGVKITRNWSVSGKVWYDLHNNNFRETDGAVSYSSQCWGVSANFVKRPGERQVMVVVQLKGLGAVKL